MSNLKLLPDNHQHAAECCSYACFVSNAVLPSYAFASDIKRIAMHVQAKTHEKVDSLGENRSIACHTVCTLLR